MVYQSEVYLYKSLLSCQGHFRGSTDLGVIRGCRLIHSYIPLKSIRAQEPKIGTYVWLRLHVRVTAVLFWIIHRYGIFRVSRRRRFACSHSFPKVIFGFCCVLNHGLLLVLQFLSGLACSERLHHLVQRLFVVAPFILVWIRQNWTAVKDTFRVRACLAVASRSKTFRLSEKHSDATRTRARLSVAFVTSPLV